MDTVHSPGVPNRRSFLGTLALGVLFVLSGCDTTGPFMASLSPKSTTPPCQVVATWQPHVLYTPDPTRNGTPGAGIAGRVYLFGPEIDHPLVGDGALVIDLYDDTPRPDGMGPKMIEQWRFDSNTLARLLKRDAIGWGYTLFLPWGTFKPEITRVQLKVRYQQLAGYKLTDQALTTLRNGGMPEPWQAKLLPLKDKQFETLDQYLCQLQKVLMPAELASFQTLLVSNAEQVKGVPLYADSGALTITQAAQPNAVQPVAHALKPGGK